MPPAVALGEITETVMGQAPPSADCNKEGKGVVFVKAGEFSEIEPLIREWTTKPLKFAKKGDVLVCVVGATAGKINLGIDCAIGRSVAAVRPQPTRLDTGYLHYFLRTRTDRLRATSQGLAQGVITREMLACLEIPLPSLSEQRRIAAILDKADGLLRKRKHTIEHLDGLTQSIFFDLFGHSSEDISKWGSPVPLSDIADIGSGITKGRKLNGQSTRQVPYLAVANVQDRKLDLTNVKMIHATAIEISRFRLRKGDLLLTEGGDPDKLGRGTLWADELSEAIHQNHIFRVRINSDAVLPLYLNWLVSSPYGKRYFLSVAKQTTGIASINKTQLSEFPTIVPPIDLQRRFARLAQIASSEREGLLSSLIVSQSLVDSLQKRAFSGEL